MSKLDHNVTRNQRGTNQTNIKKKSSERREQQQEILRSHKTRGGQTFLREKTHICSQRTKIEMKVKVLCCQLKKLSMTGCFEGVVSIPCYLKLP